MVSSIDRPWMDMLDMLIWQILLHGRVERYLQVITTLLSTQPSIYLVDFVELSITGSAIRSHILSTCSSVQQACICHLYRPASTDRVFPTASSFLREER